MKSAEEQLAETMENEEGIKKPYYKKVTEAHFDKAKKTSCLCYNLVMK